VKLSLNQAAGGVYGDMRDTKRTLRVRVLSARDQMPEQARSAASRTIASTLATRQDFQAARTLLLTLPFGSEWNTAPLFHIAFGHGKTVAVPRVDLATRMLELRAITDVERDIAPGYRGIPEPLPRCNRVDPSTVDWVLVPGVAFDVEGNRLGYGGGFYDRLLPLLQPATAKVAGAFELQVVDHIPTAVHDLPIDAIVTEMRTISRLP
jgi:5-formyltetrahydrofolate cyclo-ligase